MLVVSYRGGEKRVKVKEALPYMQLGCLLCSDYTGVFSDISAGMTETMPGYTVLVSRTEQAEDVLRKAREEGYLELSKAPPSVVEEVEMKARAKIMRATRYASELL